MVGNLRPGSYPFGMHKIDGPGSVSGTWSDGNPYAVPAIDGTVPTAAWCQAVQDELLNVTAAAGLAPDKANNAQVLAAIRDLIRFGGPIGHEFRAQARPGSTTLDLFGLPAPTIIGNATAFDLANGARIGYETADTTTVDLDFGLKWTYLVAERRWVSDWTFHVTPQVITNGRVWFGLFAADPMGVVDPTAIACAGFRWDSGVDQGGISAWRAVSSDGTATTITETTVGIVAGTDYRLRARHISGSAGKFEFYIDDVLVATHDANAGHKVPAAATPLGPVACGRRIAGTGNKSIRIALLLGRGD